jgi:hypothetical protein
VPNVRLTRSGWRRGNRTSPDRQTELHVLGPVRIVGLATAVIGDALTPPVNYHIKAVNILTQLIGKGK